MKIATFGFAEEQGKKLGRILKLSRTHPYSLVVFDPAQLPDLLLIFGEETLQAPLITELPARFRSRLIVVGKSKPATTELPHISYPLISSRVLKALDQLTCANEDDYQPIATVEADRENHQPLDPGPVSSPQQDQNALSPTPPGPSAPENNSPLSQLTPVPAEPLTPKLYRVLVVDDSKPMQLALAKELNAQFEGLKIDFADTGLEALEQVVLQDYDFIFLDIMMPGIDGFETCTRMRERKELKKTPIIMLSSKTSPLDEVKGIMAGSSTYLTKPIDSTEFQKVMARISRWLNDFSNE